MFSEPINGVHSFFDSFKKHLINMCWTTMRKWRARPRIAKRKIEVWKFYIKRSYVNQDEFLISPWQREKISQSMRHNILVANGLYGEHLCIEQFNLDERFWGKMLFSWNIFSGFHSLQKETFYRKILPITKELVIEGGTYTFHPTGLDTTNSGVVIQCFIPVGAEYYLNEKKEYVSNKIIIGDEIPLDKLPLRE